MTLRLNFPDRISQQRGTDYDGTTFSRALAVASLTERDDDHVRESRGDRNSQKAVYNGQHYAKRTKYTFKAVKTTVLVDCKTGTILDIDCSMNQPYDSQIAWQMVTRNLDKLSILTADNGYDWEGLRHKLRSESAKPVIKHPEFGQDGVANNALLGDTMRGFKSRSMHSLGSFPTDFPFASLTGTPVGTSLTRTAEMELRGRHRSRKSLGRNLNYAKTVAHYVRAASSLDSNPGRLTASLWNRGDGTPR